METKETHYSGHEYNVTKYTGFNINNTQVNLEVSLIKEKIIF